MTSRVFMETFDDYHDAEYWLENKLKDIEDGEEIKEASLRLINNHWVAGVLFQKGQMEFDFS